jgi:hypothetical protein
MTKFSYSDFRKTKLAGAWFENVEAEEVLVYGRKPWLEGSKAEVNYSKILPNNFDD